MGISRRNYMERNSLAPTLQNECIRETSTKLYFRYTSCVSVKTANRNVGPSEAAGVLVCFVDMQIHLSSRAPT